MGFVRRRARRRTALLVGGAAYAAGKHRAREQDYEDGGYDEQPAVPPQPAPAPAEQEPTLDTDELERLGKLHENGTLTDEEFANAKAKILGT